ncbi:hypothetical protein, partial [Veillonella sp.]|uniref:hypothetical protein n=2 Tax=Veillonella sp. TaxID=1926307 RepID=UPI0025D6252B
EHKNKCKGGNRVAKETGLIMDAYFRVGIWLCDDIDTEQLRAQIEDYIEHLDGAGLAEVVEDDYRF